MKPFKYLTAIAGLLMVLSSVGCDSDGQMIGDIVTLEGISMLRDETVLNLFQLGTNGEPSDLDRLVLITGD